MKHTPFSLIFLAGGMGSRMESEIPKQYLPLGDKPIALHSFELFLSMSEVQERVVVCDPQFRSIFIEAAGSTPITFALPGKERQDSVYSGLQELNNPNLVCIHDSARPFVTITQIRSVVKEAGEYGAAALGVPLKATIKICDRDQLVVETPARDKLWEMQTPQVLQIDILQAGFKKVKQEGLVATDDVYLSELVSKPVKIVAGSYSNIKITTPEDRIIAEQLLKNHVRI